MTLTDIVKHDAFMQFVLPRIVNGACCACMQNCVCATAVHNVLHLVFNLLRTSKAIYNTLSKDDSFWRIITKTMELQLPITRVIVPRWHVLLSYNHACYCCRQTHKVPIRWNFKKRVCNWCLEHGTITRDILVILHPTIIPHLRRIPHEQRWIVHKHRNCQKRTNCYLWSDVMLILNEMQQQQRNVSNCTVVV
jgi:hypothetical protein